MGKILIPRGLKGELRVAIFNENSSSLKMGQEIWLKTNEGNYFSQKIEAIKMSGEKSFIKLSDCNTLEVADSMRGILFFLSRDKFDSIDGDEHYLVDLIGSKVLDKQRKYLGIVIDIMRIPAQNIIIVEAGEKEILIPYVDEYIMFFDKRKKILIVKDLVGLIN